MASATESCNAIDNLRQEQKADDDHSPEESCNNYAETPGGLRLWTPVVPEGVKHVLRTVIRSLQEAIQMYEKYAEMSRFDTRLGTQTWTKDKSMIQLKYVLCSRAGEGVKKSIDSLDQSSSSREHRNSNFKVTKCDAHIKFRLIDDHTGYEVYYFHENHNHRLVEEEKRDLLRKRRQLDISDYNFIHHASSSNIEPTKAHKLRTSMKGGYGQPGGTVVDYKNFRRDCYTIIGPKDGEYIVKKMKNKELYVPNFSFEYQMEGKMLKSLFWANETSKLNYIEFGDVISFDAIFRTNKYKMVFVPFTGIDNHKKFVSFGAGLLSDETVPSYKWLLESFLKAHHKHPTIVLSDQDPALSQAISLVFTNSKHRLCLWHIMSKLNTKVGAAVLSATGFRKRINKLVWNAHISPEEFEQQWISLIDEYKFGQNEWLSQMYEIRSRWVSAYFKDIPMSGLIKTTSRSESANSFFRSFLHDGDTFLNFMTCFESAMEKQRYEQRCNDHMCRTTETNFLTPTKIENSASKVYTRAIFLEVQNEIYKAAWFCFQKSGVSEEDCHIIIVVHKGKQSQIKGEFKVVLNLSGPSAICTCNHFVRHGILCRHIFRVFMTYDINEIPTTYILRRWQKDLVAARFLRTRYLDADEEFERKSSSAHCLLDDCLQLVRNDKSKLDTFMDDLLKLKDKIQVDAPTGTKRRSKKDIIHSLLGVSETESLDIHVPAGIRNKGCGVGKRLIGAGEKALKTKKKGNRMCRTCLQHTDHDSRTCPIRFQKQKDC